MSQLRRELKQSRPFESREQEAALNIARTAGILGHGTTTLLKQHDLSTPQYNVLRILRGAGDDGLPCKEISERMVHRVPDVTRILDRLERAGHVRRVRGESADRRVVITTITEDGRGLLARIDRPLLELIHRQLGGLGNTKLKTLIGLLEEIRLINE